MAVKAQLVIASTGDGPTRGPFPVSFNPDTLSIQVGSEKREAEKAVNERQGVNQKAAEQPILQTGGVSVRTVAMQLKFDMVDDYRRAVAARKSQAGMDKISALVSSFDSANLLGSAINGAGILAAPTDYSSISLLNPSFSCYSLLEEAAAANLPVGFQWGSMRFFGLLTSFGSQFVYFSDQGAPLRADVSLAIRCGMADPGSDAAMKQAQAQQKAEAGRTPPGAV